MFDKLKYIKDLQSRAGQLKEILAGEEVEGQAAFGKVKIVMDGNMNVVLVQIDSELASQKESLQIALAEAFNDAIKKAHEVIASKLKEFGLPADLDIPGV